MIGSDSAIKLSDVSILTVLQQFFAITTITVSRNNAILNHIEQKNANTGGPRWDRTNDQLIKNQM